MEFQPHYPGWLEDWWVGQVGQHIGDGSSLLEIDRLVPVVQALSDRFVEDTHQPFSAYDRDIQTLLAYGLFYFPQTFVRVQWPILELMRFRGWNPPLHRPLRILDLGAGLGGAALGAITALLSLYPELSLSSIHLTAVDHGAHNLSWLQRMMRELSQHWPNVSLDTRHENFLHYGQGRERWSVKNTPDMTHVVKGERSQHWSRASEFSEPSGGPSMFQREEEESWDMVISSFALTEVFRGQTGQEMWCWLQGVMRCLVPGGVLLVLEPASQDSCVRLEEVRDQIAVEGEFTLWGPCLHQRSCPLHVTGSSWCHEVRRWDAPDSLKLLNRRLFREIQVLRFGFLLVGKQPPSLTPFAKHTFRLIAPVLKRKGHWLTTGCSAEGDKLQIEIFQRDLKRDQVDELEQIERGNLLHASDLQDRSRPDQPHRYRLIADQSLSQVFPDSVVISISTGKKDNRTL